MMNEPEKANHYVRLWLKVVYVWILKAYNANPL